MVSAEQSGSRAGVCGACGPTGIGAHKRHASTLSGTGAARFRSTFQLDRRGRLYEQLTRSLKRAIIEGHFRPGELLPATRAMAQTLGVSRNTVVTAYEILCAEQLVSAHARSGIRVAETLSSANLRSKPGLIPPQSRYAARLRRLGPAAMGPIREGLRYDLHPASSCRRDLMGPWNRKLVAAARAAGTSCADPKGSPLLRRAIAEYLERRRGLLCSEDDILVVSGTQQAFTVAARAVLDEGDAVAIEDPHDPYLMGALTAHGAQLFGVRMDANGMAAAELARQKVRMICVSPSNQLLCGPLMSLERRIELINIASRQGSWILEDDRYSELSLREQPLAALRCLDHSDRAIYVGAFSRTLSPSPGIGFIVCPASLRDDMYRLKLYDDPGDSSVQQAALAAFMLSRQFDRHLRRCLLELEHLRTVFLGALRNYAGGRITVQQSHASTHLVLWLPGLRHAQIPRLLQLGVARSLGLYPLQSYYCVAPECPGLTVGYAGLSAPALECAAKLIGECLDELDQDSAQ